MLDRGLLFGTAHNHLTIFVDNAPGIVLNSSRQEEKMHGFAHIEIPTTDTQKSKEFYSKIFGWKIDESAPNYVTFSTGDNQGGGFTQESKPAQDGVVLYIEVED